jgi:RNA polymerase sigma factor FliA
MRLSAAAAAAEAPDLRVRDELVMSHVSLVRSLANRLGRTVPSHVELSELVSVGVLGLMEAAERYQPALGVPFDAFARRRIHGAMLDALRRLDRVPRSLRRVQRQVDAALTELRHALGREPEPAEVAGALDLPIEEYEARLDDLRWADVAAVRRVRADEPAEDLLEIVVDPEAGPYVQTERRELSRELVRALGELPDRERQVLALSYEEELTLAEIGEVLGVSESRVSQIRTQAVARLRSLLQEWLRAQGESR